MSTLRIVLLLVGVALLAVALLVLLRTRSQTASGSTPEYQLFGPGIRDDERFWRAGGLFYNNPDDPALFVLNRWGLGITLNLAHPLARWVAIGTLLVLALVPVVLTLLFPGVATPGNGCHPFSGCHLGP